MTPEIQLLVTTAAVIAFMHTLMGPDHYLPFVVMSKARKWNTRHTLTITTICGLGHIAGSIILGVVGVALGTAVGHLEWFESVRASIATWSLIAFGLTYLVWGWHKAAKQKTDIHIHEESGIIHSHAHNRKEGHVHQHTFAKETKDLTPWVIFVIFVLGPCEPLIPLLMYPAANENLIGLIWVTATFGIITMLTMLFAVAASLWGIQFIKLPNMHRYSHAMAGGTILTCGLSMQFLGL